MSTSYLSFYCLIIVILILMAGGSVFWLKKNKMFCFAEESRPDTKDVEKEGEKVTNIYSAKI